MCDRVDWPCVREDDHDAPRGCVHHGTSGVHGHKHEDDGGDS